MREIEFKYRLNDKSLEEIEAEVEKQFPDANRFEITYDDRYYIRAKSLEDDYIHHFMRIRSNISGKGNNELTYKSIIGSASGS